MSGKNKLAGFVVPVFAFLRRVPRGKVVTYGAVAKRCGVPCPRNVGWILRQNAVPDAVPCYKVILADGRLARGYKFGGRSAQARRLKKDGVPFSGPDRVDHRAIIG